MKHLFLYYVLLEGQHFALIKDISKFMPAFMRGNKRRLNDQTFAEYSMFCKNCLTGCFDTAEFEEHEVKCQIQQKLVFSPSNSVLQFNDSGKTYPPSHVALFLFWVYSWWLRIQSWHCKSAQGQGLLHLRFHGFRSFQTQVLRKRSIVAHPKEPGFPLEEN